MITFVHNLCVMSVCQQTVKEAEDVREVREMLECTSGYKHYFYVIVMGAQIVFVLFGVFLAWQTRQVLLVHGKIYSPIHRAIQPLLQTNTLNLPADFSCHE